MTALAFASHLIFMGQYVQQSVPVTLFLSAFLMSLAGYLYLRFTKNNILHMMTFFSGILFCIALRFYLHTCTISLKNGLSISAAGILVWMYHARVFLKRIRGNAFVKPAFIAMVWLLMIYFYIQQWDMLIYLQQFVFIYVLTIPFDIRDMKSDSFTTLPKLLGIPSARFLMIFLMVVYAALSLIMPRAFMYTSFISAGVLIPSFFLSYTYQKLWVYVFYDGIIVLQTILLCTLLYGVTLFGWQILLMPHLF